MILFINLLNVSSIIKAIYKLLITLVCLWNVGKQRKDYIIEINCAYDSNEKLHKTYYWVRFVSNKQTGKSENIVFRFEFFFFVFGTLFCHKIIKCSCSSGIIFDSNNKQIYWRIKNNVRNMFYHSNYFIGVTFQKFQFHTVQFLLSQCLCAEHVNQQKLNELVIVYWWWINWALVPVLQQCQNRWANSDAWSIVTATNCLKVI